MPKKTPSRRALERSAIQAKYKDMSAYRLESLYDENKLNLKELQKYYVDARSIAQKRIARIQKSDVPFVDAPPVFAPSKGLTPEQLLKEVGEINKFLRGQTYGATTVPERRKIREKAIETLHKHGLDFINNSNFNDWAKFQRWYKNTAVSLLSDSDADVLVNIFQQAAKEDNSNPDRWKELYTEFQQNRLNRSKRRKARRKK